MGETLVAFGHCTMDPMCLGSQRAGSHVHCAPYSSGDTFQILPPRSSVPTAKNGLARQRISKQGSGLLKRLGFVRWETEEKDTTEKCVQEPPGVSGYILSYAHTSRKYSIGHGTKQLWGLKSFKEILDGC